MVPLARRLPWFRRFTANNLAVLALAWVSTSFQVYLRTDLKDVVGAGILDVVTYGIKDTTDASLGGIVTYGIKDTTDAAILYVTSMGILGTN